MFTLGCKICEGDPKFAKCMFCGAKRLKTEYDKQYLKDLKHMFNMLKRGQAATTGVPEKDNEIKRIFGDWIREPKPLWETEIKLLYNEAHQLEKIDKDLKAARIKYAILHQKMKDDDRIHSKITKDVIKKKIDDLIRQEKLKTKTKTKTKSRKKGERHV